MFGFGGSKANDRIAITFDGEDSRPKKKLSSNAAAFPVFASIEPVTGAFGLRPWFSVTPWFVSVMRRSRAGVVEIRVPQGKKLEHQGIKIEVIGQVRRSARVVVRATCSEPRSHP